MRVDGDRGGYALAFTPWHNEAPARVGWYEVSLAADIVARAYWTGSAWSAPCDPASCRRTHARARRTSWALRGARPLWRGLAQRSARWLAAELAR